MNRRSTYQRLTDQNWPRRMQVALVAALVTAAPLLGWAILAAYLPAGGHR
jgi:hypothetical protein